MEDENMITYLLKSANGGHKLEAEGRTSFEPTSQHTDAGLGGGNHV